MRGRGVAFTRGPSLPPGVQGLAHTETEAERPACENTRCTDGKQQQQQGIQLEQTRNSELMHF